MKYANISMENKLQNEGNLGDYIQFLSIDYVYSLMGINSDEIVQIEYWDLMDYDGEEVILPINFFYFNPSFDNKPFILSKRIHPVYLGIHLPGKIGADEADYLSKYTPIGCRDENTVYLLKKSNISHGKTGLDCYLQGCITAVLPKRKSGNYDKVYLVDIPNDIKKEIPCSLTQNCIEMSQLLYDDISSVKETCGVDSIKEYVRQRFILYRDTAKLIITSRMHCAIPCTAMGIPVVFVVPSMSPRFTWIEKILPIYTYDKLDEVNWNPLPIEYEDMKNRIIDSTIKRIKGETDVEQCLIIDDWYKQRIRKECIEGRGIDSFKRFVKENWNKKEKIKYIIWGITATSEEVCNWIDNNYPNARIVAAIDEYRDLSFRGLKTIRSSNLDEFIDCYFIGTGASASNAMMKVLEKRGDGWLEHAIPIIP